MFFQSSSVVVSKLLPVDPPTLFTRISTGPTALTVSEYTAWVPSLVVTSASIPITLTPNFVNSFSADFISSLFSAHIPTLQPSLASAEAI